MTMSKTMMTMTTVMTIAMMKRLSFSASWRECAEKELRSESKRYDGSLRVLPRIFTDSTYIRNANELRLKRSNESAILLSVTHCSTSQISISSEDGTMMLSSRIKPVVQKTRARRESSSMISSGLISTSAS
jgi:hypothetical protein